jgi:hypothetical protein
VPLSAKDALAVLVVRSLILCASSSYGRCELNVASLESEETHDNPCPCDLVEGALFLDKLSLSLETIVLLAIIQPPIRVPFS